jgi:hypothetical protein
MRTTVRLDDALMKEVKRYAAKRGITLTKVIEESLREKLARSESLESRKPFKLITHKGGGLQPEVNLDDNSSLLDLMEGIE